MRILLIFIIYFLALTQTLQASINSFPQTPLFIKPYAEVNTFVLKAQSAAVPTSLPGSKVDNVIYVLGQPHLGIAVSYGGKIGFSMSYSPQTSKDPYLENKTFSEDYHLSFNTRSLHAEINYMRAQGGTIRNSPDFRPGSSADRLSFEPSIYLATKGVNLFFLLRPEGFSLSSAFEQTTRQENSGGSLILSASASQQTLSGDPFIPSEIQANFGEDATLKSGQFTNATASIGFGGALILNRSWYLAGMGTIGAGAFSYGYTTQTTSPSGNGSLRKSDLRISSGYNGDQFTLALIYSRDATVFRTNAIEFTASLESYILSSGLRF